MREIGREIETIEDFREALRDCESHYNSIDAEVVRELGSCTSCGGPLAYEGFKREYGRGGREYHAVMYCKRCHKAEEF